MRSVKRVLCLVLAALLLVGLAPARTAAAELVYFTAVNDQLLPLNDETMPFWSGGVLYIPHTAMDSNDLGIHYSRNRERMTVVLYKLRDAITFDLAAGTSETTTGQVITEPALVRGDVVFLPVDALCRFFGLEYTFTRITYGYLVRVKSESVVLSDSTFINAAGSGMAQRYAQYERAHTPVPDDPVEPAQDTKPPEPVIPQRIAYLVFESTDAAYTDQVLSQLSSNHAAFLFSKQDLEGADDLLRRLTALGCPIVLRVDGSAGGVETLHQIEDANRALWTAANAKTRLVRLEGANEDTIHAVEEAGYCPLRFSLDYSGGYASVSRMSTRIFSAADANHSRCCVFLGTDEAASGILTSLLTSLRAGNCTPARLNEVAAQL